MLHNWEAARIVACSIDHFCPSKIILDPVMISTSGSKLIEDETIEVIVKELFHRVTLITPNIDEAAFLSGMQIRNEEEMEIAAQKLLVLGCRAVLMKGGHLEGKEMADICLHTMKLRSDWLCRPFRLKIHTVQVAHSRPPSPPIWL